MGKKILGLALALVTTFGASLALAQGYSGHWETDAGAVNGRGAGHLGVDVTQTGSGLRWAAGNGGVYVCTLQGNRCAGTWTGSTGSGWFDIIFSSDGNSFSGTWGYGTDRSQIGTWSGRRS